jgi:hypothetical protein
MYCAERDTSEDDAIALMRADALRDLVDFTVG